MATFEIEYCYEPVPAFIRGSLLIEAEDADDAREKFWETDAAWYYNVELETIEEI